MSHKSAFVAIVGRPNTGKSTLINTLVGEKVAITSHHPNTTRSTIRGILTSPGVQFVFVDTPGIHKPKTLLGGALNTMVEEGMDSVDIAIMCIPAVEKIGSGDEYIARAIAAKKEAKKICVITMVDMVDKSKIPNQLLSATELAKKSGFEWDEIVPLSAKIDLQIDTLLEVLEKYAPEGPAFYPEEMKSDRDRDSVLADLIREAAIEGLFEEVPHSVAVTIDDFSQRENKKNFYDIHASIIVERDSQKGILIGKGGQHLKEIGSRARSEIEKNLGGRVYLDIQVKVMPRWQSDPKALSKLGFTQP
ncbi:MAG: GTPase Era [Actinobacteria bacterium]|jgi:GTP-binding protein Era|nr:GTPase Era [Actinomycetota bacterium]NCW35011.1 GTPase Era [Actinomycetota bacterium]NCZ73032.1 GTPase Era [Actinomycetota bacterium]NDA41185.1 GTPase Era [Actinomycetota bacterium]NDB31151.1 GTPase Era [Actinomycetota bacterium]